MKKITFTSKTKKITMITGIAVVCIGVLSFVLLQHANAKSSDSLPTASSNTSSVSLVAVSSGSVSVDSIVDSNSNVASGTAGTGSSFVPAKGKTQSAPLTQTSKPTAPPKPVIQGDSRNGQQPTNNALTNKSTKPSYVAPPKAPTARYSGISGGSTTTKKPNGGTTTNKQVDGGSTTGNKPSGGSDPIFGNKHGTGGQETTAKDMYEDGTKVGIMD